MISMIEQNAESLNKSLQEDLNCLIKNIHVREDMYLTLLQYNKNIIANVDEIEQKSFLTDEIQKHRNFLSEIQADILPINNSELQIKQKYLGYICCDFADVKLLGRMTARVLELCQTCVEQAKPLDNGIGEKFNCFRNVLRGGFSENGKVNVEAMLHVIIEYGNGKYIEEVERLEKIMVIIGQGDFEEFSSVYSSNSKDEKNGFQSLLEKEEKISCKEEIIRKKKTEQEVQEQRKREEEERIIVQKMKKKKAKFVKELIDNMGQVMDLAKQSFIENYDYCSNIEEKRMRLYQELLQKNKFNQHEIVSFQQKKPDFTEKIKKFQEVLQENPIIQPTFRYEEQKIDKKIPIREVLRKLIKADSIVEENQIVVDQVPEEIEKVLRKREFKIHTKTNSVGLVKDSAFSSMQQIHEGLQNLKVEVKGDDLMSKSNRFAKLPQIPIRSSFEQREDQRNLRTNSDKKEEKRTNIAKNVEIGFDYLASNNISCIHKNFAFESSTLKNRNLSMEPHVNNFLESSPKIMRGNMEQNFYAWKKMTSFYES